MENVANNNKRERQSLKAAPEHAIAAEQQGDPALSLVRASSGARASQPITADRA